MSNSDNPKNGANFQLKVMEWLIKEYNNEFELEKKIAIGNPAKDHKFDIVCEAKKSFTNEAAFYLSFLSDDYDKRIVMLRSFNSKRQESLAEYYYRTYKHLIGDIRIFEYDPESDKMREIKDDME